MCLSTISRRFALAVFLTFLSMASPALLAQAHSDLPDAPTPAGEQQTTANDSTAAPQAKTANDQASEDLKTEEKQRIFGIMPDFNMMNNADAPPLSPKQKFHLFWKSSTDPFAFMLASIVAGIGQAEDNFPEYGQGAEGYFKRFGAAYADAFDGNLWGNAILPTILHEDPRYFRKGTGSVGGRVMHAALSTVWSRRDNGNWGPNYANVLGNIIGGGISNAYYPESDRGVGLTFDRALVVTAEGAIGAQLVEFWPDISRKFLNRKSHQTGAQDLPSGSAPQK